MSFVNFSFIIYYKVAGVPANPNGMYKDNLIEQESTFAIYWTSVTWY